MDKVAFSGSAEVGKLIARGAAGNVKKVSLELGGKSPLIVVPDADLERAIPGAASAIRFDQSQTCCAGSRLVAHPKVFDRVLKGVAEIAGRIEVGPGLDPSTEMGPLVSDEHFGRVKGYIESGRNEGARFATGCDPGVNGGDTNGGYFVQPTVLTDVKPSIRVVREEIFGPALVAERYDDDLDRIATQANDTVFGLTGDAGRCRGEQQRGGCCKHAAEREERSATCGRVGP